MCQVSQMRGQPVVEDLPTVQNVENQGGGTREISVNQRTIINNQHGRFYI